jgi:uncharacterized membrane protein YfcA
MSEASFMLVLLIAACGAGTLGALTGLGGGVVIVPLLMLGFGVDLRYAVGASLVAVIATSCGSATSFLRTGTANIRVGMLLETATVIGAIIGTTIAGFISTAAITYVFVGALFYSAYATLRQPAPHAIEAAPDAIATRLRLDSILPGPGGAEQPYAVRNVPMAMGVMGLAGVLSALVGIGGGILKVVAMDRLMRMPFKASTTTSNLTLMVTAGASAGIYLHRGQIDPRLAGPVAIGAVLGSLLGARLITRLSTKWLRRVFAIVVVASGIELLRRTIGGGA